MIGTISPCQAEPLYAICGTWPNRELVPKLAEPCVQAYLSESCRASRVQAYISETCVRAYISESCAGYDDLDAEIVEILRRFTEIMLGSSGLRNLRGVY
jgi:hypothetical protein